MAAPSAKGLFRATGKVSSDTTAREEHDFYPTPSEVTRAFLSAEGARLKELGRVWEPACGDGAMSKELTGFGLECVCTDLIDRGCPDTEIGSFYDYSEALAPAIVTNPPYCEINARDGKGRWLQHSLGLGVEYAAFFLNADWPYAAGLSGLLSRHPISRIYGCRWKVDFTGKGAPPQRNAWFVWDRTWGSKDTAFRLLDRTDVRQSAWGF
ncbi:hypothetical protein PXK30_03625 [Phaeobacter gallaeciensis]|uniref:hypothetical protein n=1 Tax=Phaeobacter gallaeciensis TaxID=60890 RepID=UPI00237F9579|nr:hypothetical protein [Phaeobacter gallaeciensis]MDE4303998.1 hypothetical protein [Phaeobacter gallaeciensis]MDE4309058.1 hypothetical protein [Phaeobacter gallaeciensis]MDE4313388.1 hypothetical protein [Phaeobacter gallaeciensis]MDE4317987.1 hypothetical protein [Phaeobacter gallaeciensis]MDE4322450.1 hypothetical protein [Phaeobacter gallaeciensis]